jgi:glyoxylase-like metal-dependent hydrolase (beta-lactamase superfamily II)
VSIRHFGVPENGGVRAAPEPSVTRVDDGVHFVRTALANWVLLTDGDEVGLIDCGYPGHLEQVRRSIRQVLGRDVPVGTVLVTHAHADHIGTAARLVATDGTRVLCAPAEVAGVRREEKYQVDIADVARHPRPVVLRWVVQAIRAGGLKDVAVPTPHTIDGPLVVAGHRVEPLDVPGHTPGHLAFWLPDAHALVSGDALITGHPISRRQGPQMLHPMYHQDLALNTASLDRLATVPARVLLPGHGPLLTVENMADVVEQARRDHRDG